jgi:hypothetical protein
VPEFKGKRVVMGGRGLDNKLTLGDYDMNSFKTVFVFNDGCSSTDNLCIISVWREETYELSEADANEGLKNKWYEEFLGVQNSNIVELNNNLSTFKSLN